MLELAAACLVQVTDARNSIRFAYNLGMKLAILGDCHDLIGAPGFVAKYGKRPLPAAASLCAGAVSFSRANLALRSLLHETPESEAAVVEVTVWSLNLAQA